MRIKKLMVKFRSILPYYWTKMSSYSNNKHLEGMSQIERALILERIQDRKNANFPYVVIDNVMYFLQDDELVCVSLQQENGVYHFCFNGRNIVIDCTTGKCSIVDADRNCLEYFCVPDFFKNALQLQNKHHNLLYRLLIRERIDKVDRKSIRSFSMFFTTSEVVGQIERAGQSSLKSPLGCLSIHGMIQGIKRFIVGRVSACFMPSSNLFRMALCANPIPSQRPSVDEFYGIGLFLNSKFKLLQSVGMISLIMRRFVGNDLGGVFKNQIAHGFLRMMNGSLSLMMIKKFMENPIGFQKTDQMDKLVRSCPFKIVMRLQTNFPISIPDCVSGMIAKNNIRAKKITDVRTDWFTEQYRLEQQRLEQQRLEQQRLEEEHQRKRSFKVFREGLAGIEVDVSQAQKGRCILDEFACGGGAMMKDETETRKRGRELDAFKFEDEDAFKFEDEDEFEDD